jgi:hypothetical protein
MCFFILADLPAMRYTECNNPTAGQQCFHEPTPILQIFNVKLQTSLPDVASPVEVYGIVAVRDDEDYCRNYLFNRSRENPLDISLVSATFLYFHVIYALEVMLFFIIINVFLLLQTFRLVAISAC